MNTELLHIFVMYVRLVIYPLLTYTMIIYSYSVLYEKHKDLSKIFVLLSTVFTFLWSSSIIYFITRDNTLVVNFNSFGLIPLLISILIYLWLQICKNCKEQRRILKGN